jgi:hypothetical protein
MFFHDLLTMKISFDELQYKSFLIAPPEFFVADNG